MKVFQSEQRSLFGEILDWMLTPILLLWPISLVLTWLVAQGIAGKPFDRALEYNAGVLAQYVTVQHDQVHFSLPQPARELLRAEDSDTVYYQVLGPQGQVLSGDVELPAPLQDEHNPVGEVRLRDLTLGGVDLKVASMWVHLDMPGNQLALVQVAETMDKRAVLATEIVKGVMLPQFVVLPVAVLLVWLALAQAIKPLNRLEETIRARKPDDLSPLDAQAVPMEVVPLVAGDATVVPAATALRMATLNGARALGMADITGSLEVGKQCDLIAVKVLGEVEFEPLFSVVSHLVYVADRNHVTDVWVAGQQLLDNKRLTTIDEEEVVRVSKEMGAKVKEHRAETSTIKINSSHRRCC